MTSKLNVIAREPVAVAALASIIVWVAAKYGVRVDAQQASEAAGVVLLVAGAFARQLVTPTAKVPPAPAVPVNASGNVTVTWPPRVEQLPTGTGGLHPPDTAKRPMPPVPPKG
jgi:hypothetical protein